MNGGGSRSQSCAACRYRRCKCSPDCPLAPYFPASHGAQFRNVHRLFGVGNITNALENLRPPDRDNAAQSMMFEADARAADPVWGCCRVIFQLQYEIVTASAELNFVLHQLTLRRDNAFSGALVDANILSDCQNVDYAMWQPPDGDPVSPVELQFEVMHNNDRQIQQPVEMEDSSSSCHPPLHLLQPAVHINDFRNPDITPVLEHPIPDHQILPHLAREEEEGREEMSGVGSCTQQGEDVDCSDCHFFVIPHQNDRKEIPD